MTWLSINFLLVAALMRFLSGSWPVLERPFDGSKPALNRFLSGSSAVTSAETHSQILPEQLKAKLAVIFMLKRSQSMVQFFGYEHFC